MPRDNRAYAALQAEGTGTTQGGGGEGGMGGHGLGVAAGAFGEQRGLAHFLKGVEAVVAGRAVGSEADVNASL